MLLSCVDFIQRHFALSSAQIVYYFVPVRKKDIPDFLFDPWRGCKSGSFVMYDSDKNDFYVAFKSTRGFCYYRSCDSRVPSSWIPFSGTW